MEIAIDRIGKIRTHPLTFNLADYITPSGDVIVSVEGRWEDDNSDIICTIRITKEELGLLNCKK